MKLKKLLSQILCGCAVAVTASAQQSLTWDPGKSGGSGGAGTWDLNTSADWYNGSADVKWLDNSLLGTNGAIFGGTAGTVTLNSSLSASNLLFNTTGYTISGSGTLTLGAGGIDASPLSSGTTTIGVGLSLASAQQTWQVGSGGTLAVNGAITRQPGAAVDFSASGVTSSSLANVNGVIGGWATVGGANTAAGDWAATSSGSIGTFTGYTVISSTASSSQTGAGASTQNWICGDPTGANNYVTTLTASAIINSLVEQGDFALNSGVTLTLGDGGYIARGTSRWMTGGTTAYLTSGSATGELFVHAPDAGSGGNWTIWPVIENNGATPLILVKDGVDIVKLGNMSTYTGGTIVNAGTLASTCDALYGNGNASPGLITPFGAGPITIQNGGVLQLGNEPGNAFGSYHYPNNVSINNGGIYAWDASQRIEGNVAIGAGGAGIGSTFDNSPETFAETNFPKALFIDGLITGSGNLTVQDSPYGQTGNPWNTSCAVFTSAGTAAQNTYSGTVTVDPLTVAGSGGCYLYLVGTNVMANATINLTGDNLTSGRMGTGTLLFGNGNVDGPGYMTIGGLTGSGDVTLSDTMLYSGTPGYSNGIPVALSVGYNNASTTYSGVLSGSGSLVKIGSGTLTLSGTETYSGNTTVAQGKLSLTGASLSSSNIIINSGATLDVSALGSAILASGQSLLNGGTVNGSVSASSGSEVFGDNGSGYGTNTINNNLTLNSGATVHVSVSTSASGPDDLISVAGTLSANNNIIHVSAPSGSASLQAADYTIITSANPISGTFVSAPSWDVAPANAGNFSIVVSGNTVKLHYAAATSPTGGGVATPSPALRNQNVLITVTTTNGTGGTVNSVVVNASPIGGSSSLSLVNAGGNVWTNSVAVAPGILAGGVTLVATITDTASLNGIVNIPLTVAVGNDVWNGAGGDANWSTGLNWTNKFAPGYVGDSIEFAGNNQLSPNMDNNYTITALLFDAGAGGFNIGGGNTLTLTGNGPITVNSASAQTLNVTLAGGGITKLGNGTLNLTASETYTGPTVVSDGILNISAGIASITNVIVGNAAGDSVLNLSGAVNLNPYNILVGNTTNAAGAIYQNGANVSATADTAYDSLSVGNMGGSYGYYDANGGSLTVSGIAVGGEDNNGVSSTFGNPAGNGIMDITGGATVNDIGWFVMSRNANAEIGILNMYSGSLTYAGGGLVCNWGAGQTSIINVMGGTMAPPFLGTEGIGLGGNTSGILNLNGGLVQAGVVGGNFGGTGGQLNFNGGTLQASANSTAFILVNSATVYSGSALIDNDGNTVTVAQPLLAPSGNGVYGIASFTGGAGYIAPPIVTIVPGSGDTTGTGATAIAQINPLTGTVTNVIITCPGQNYTAVPTFVLSGGGATVPATITGTTPVSNVSGGLIALSSFGGGTLTLSGASTYTGSTVVSNGTTLALAAGGSISASTNILTDSGSIFDVSALSSFTLAGGQTLSGLGSVNGSVTASAGSFISAGIPGTPGVNTFNNNLTFGSGADASLALSTAYNGNNDQIAVSGTLTANNNVIHLSAPSSSSSLDTTADYVLITAGSISGTFASAPVWDVAPVNAGHYSIVTSGTTVTLHYSASVTVPTVAASATPATLLRNQPVLITANVTPGSASILTVTVDLSSIGASLVTLVESNTSSLYTNTVAVPATAAPGSDMVTVTATDSANNSGSTSLALNIVAGNDVWNGAGGDNNFSTGLNWTNKIAPGYVGDSVEFGGNTQLSPNMDNNYTITGLKFDASAGGFSIGSANSSTLTLSGATPIVNNSANTQTINVTIAGTGGGLTKSGGPVTLAANNTYPGPTVIASGTLNVTGGIVASNASTIVGSTAGNSVLNISGSLAAYAILVGNYTNAVGAVYQNGGTVWANAASGVDNLCLGNVPGSYGYYDAASGTVTVNGVCMAGEDNSGTGSTFGMAGNAVMDINSGATVNDTSWFVMARNNNSTNGNEIAVLNVNGGYLTYAGGGFVGPWDTGESAIINVMGGVVSNTAAVGVYLGNVGYDGILNLNGGTLQASIVQGYNGPSYAAANYGQLNFNGGTLQPSAASSSFIQVNGATIYGGGATINNNSFAVTVAQPLLAPSGNGVHGIGSFTGGTGYVAPPIVTITNGVGDTTGTGATAIAQINPLTGTVTNIVITCPGVNYTATPVFVVRGGGATVPATITGTAPTADVSGGLTSTGTGTLTLTGTNTYTGATVISSGTLVLSGNGSIAASTNINVSSSSSIFDVSGAKFTLGAAQALTGVGTVNGNFTNNGTIMAGTSGTTGVLSFNNNLTLQSGGTTVVKLNPAQSANDQIYCFGTLTYGGTLQIENLGGTLQLGNTFQVFFTGGSAGNFANISGSPGAGLAYNFNPSTGVITVVTASASITGLKFTASPVVSGTSVSFSATNSGAGTVYMLTATNLAPPVSWSPIWTNVLGGSSSFTTNLANAAKPGAKQQFYILSTTNN